MTRHQEVEARKKHSKGMNAVLEELKRRQAVEVAVESAVSPAQQRASQWKGEAPFTGRGLPKQPPSTTASGVATVATSHMATPTVREDLISFAEAGEEVTAAGDVPVVPNVAAAIKKHGMAAAHEALMTPRTWRPESKRESRRTALQEQFDDVGDVAGAQR